MLQVREVPGSIHSQGLRHTDVKMVPVVPLFSNKKTVFEDLMED